MMLINGMDYGRKKGRKTVHFRNLFLINNIYIYIVGKPKLENKQGSDLVS